jgi:hypothetical protein
VEKKANDTFAFDLDNRLDDFFDDSLPEQEDGSVAEPATSKDDHPIKELKSTILAIDWEITDDVLNTFIDQVAVLGEHYSDDKIAFTLLKILRSLGKYIRTHKSKAHPGAIKRVMAVYSALEESVANAALSPAEKDGMLQEEIKQFQQLKSQIMEQAAPHSAAAEKKPAGKAETPGMDAIVKRIDELKAKMEAELSAIWKELKRLSK